MNERSVFLAALDKTDSAERAAYLDAACAGDETLRQQVERLLRAHVPEDSFLEKPAVALGTTSAFEPLREAAGSKIGSYKLLQQIGEGGMGVVYMAEQETPVRRRVALKIIKPGMDSAQVLARFEAERQAIALMDHQNIARIYDAGTTETGRPYFVMELVHGVPITKYCDDNHLTPKERLELFVPVCQAIQHAHQKGVIHRDIKPTNVLVCLYDGKPVPKVIDFGVAKATSQPLTERTMFTQFGTLVGTLEYMSPEQAEMSQLGIDTRSDVYSLGVLLYELLTGATPLDRKQLREAAFDEVLRIIREQEPPKPSTRLSNSGAALAGISAQRKTEPGRLTRLVRGELDWIVMKALEKDRGRRYDTASGLAQDIERYLKDEPVEACPPSAGYRLRKLVRKHRTPLMAAGVFALLLLAGTIVSSWQAFRATHAESDALEARKTSLINEQTAHENEKLANHERIEATTANNHLRDSQEELRQTLYYARSNLLQNAWDAHSLGRVFDLLEQQRPRPDERDLRGFEWYYRDRLAHQELLTIASLGDNSSLLAPAFGSAIAPAFSPNGNYVVAPKVNRSDERLPVEIAVYDLATGKERCRFHRDLKELVDLLLWSADSKRVLVSADGKGRARVQEGFSAAFVVYDAATGDEAFRLKPPVVKLDPGNGPGIYCQDATFSPDGKYLAVSWAPMTLQKGGVTLICEAPTGKVLRTIDASSQRMAFHPDGRLFAAAVAVGRAPIASQIKVWDIETGEERLATPELTGLAAGVAFSPNGSRLGAAFSIAGQASNVKAAATIAVWDTVSGKELITLATSRGPTPESPRATFHFSSDSTRLTTVLANAHSPMDVNLWDLATGKKLDTLREGIEFSLAEFNADGKLLVTANGSTVQVWDLAPRPSGSVEVPPQILPGHIGSVSAFRFHPDGTRLFTAGTEGTVKVWDLKIRDQPLIFRGPGIGRLGAFAFSAAAERVVAISGDGPGGRNNQKVMVWNLSGKLLHSYPINRSSQSGARAVYRTLALNSTGTKLASVAPFGTPQKPEGGEGLTIVDVDTGMEVFGLPEKLQELRMQQLRFSPDGKRLAGGNTILSPDDRTSSSVVIVLDASDGKEIARTASTNGPLTDFQWSSDGKHLATATIDPKGGVKLWDATSGAELLTFQGTATSFVGWRLVFSADGTQLAGVPDNLPSGKDFQVALWDTATGRQIQTLKGHSGAILNLTFSPNGRRLATAGSLRQGTGLGGRGRTPGEVKLWDTATGNELLTLKELEYNTAQYLAFNDHGTRLYAAGPIGSGPIRDIEIRCWDATPRPEAKQP